MAGAAQIVNSGSFWREHGVKNMLFIMNDFMKKALVSSGKK